MSSRTFGLGVFLALDLAIAAFVGCSSEPSSLLDSTQQRAADLSKRIGVAPATSGFEIAASGRLRAIDPSGHGYAASIELPASATGSVHIVDERSTLGVEVSLEGARDARAETISGFVRYASAISGADMIQRVARDGVEDFLVFDRAPAIESVRYRVDLGDARGLRLFARTLEILDRDGVPRLRVQPPTVVDATGARRPASLAVEGCAVDIDQRPPWHRPLTAPGASHCTLVLDWANAHVVYPAVVDPSWTTTGSLVIARQSHTATLLPSGVLVVGGFDQSAAAIAESETYALPPLGVFSITASLTTPRGEHTATLLASSKILIAGGAPSGGAATSLATAEIYDPLSGFAMVNNSMVAQRVGHTATLLTSGKVLITGGTINTTLQPDWAEVFDPGASPVSGTFQATTGAMAVRRSAHAASLLSKPGAFTGQVLITGGTSGLDLQATAERYNPATDSFTTTTQMVVARAYHTSTELADGSILIAGGGDGLFPIAAVDLYTQANDGFVKTGDLPFAREDHDAVLLGSGAVVLVGGQNFGELPDGGLSDGGLTDLVDTVIYDPMKHTFAETAPLLVPRRSHTATLLVNQILVAGGSSGTAPLGEAEILGIPCAVDGDCGTGHCAEAESVCCDTDCSDLCASCTAVGKGGGFDGTCDFATAGASAAVCQGDLAVVIQCDGKGGVNNPNIQDCKPYGCSGNACATSCQGAIGCSTTAYCLPNGTCQTKSQNGVVCKAATECASGFCANGICCNTTCDGQCEACDVAGKNGTCAPVVGPPHAIDKACDGTDPDCKSACDGVDVSMCTYPGDKTSCGFAICSDAILTPNACDGKGACKISAAKKCSGNLECDGANACKTACVKDADCAKGYVCNAENACAAFIGSVCDGVHTIEFDTGGTKDCTPYGCEGQLCRETCRDVRDCVAPNVCDRNNHCVPLPADADASAACSMSRSDGSMSGLWALAAVVALARRRRGLVTSSRR